MNNFIEEFESIIQKEDFPANPEYSAEKIKKRRIIIYGAGNGLITLSIFVLQRFDIKCETILDRKYAAPELCNGIIYAILINSYRTQRPWNMHWSSFLLEIRF